MKSRTKSSLTVQLRAFGSIIQQRTDPNHGPLNFIAETFYEVT